MKPAGIEKQKKTTRIRPRVDGSLFFFSSIPRIRPQKAWLRVLLLFPRPSLWAGLGSARLFSLTVFGSCFFCLFLLFYCADCASQTKGPGWDNGFSLLSASFSEYVSATRSQLNYTENRWRSHNTGDPLRVAPGSFVFR